MLPYQVYLMLPYLLSILALVLVARKARLSAGPDEALSQRRALMLDLLVNNADLPDGRTGIDIAVKAAASSTVDGRPSTATGRARRSTRGGRLVTPPFVDPHFHMDATLSLGLPRVNECGTLLEGIALWGELKPLLTQEALVERALRLLRLGGRPGACSRSAAMSTSATTGLLAVEALLDVKRAGHALSRPAARGLSAGRRPALAERASTTSSARSTWASTSSAASRISSAPWPTAPRRCELLCEIAAERGLMVDLHCDESDDPLSRHIETLAAETQRLGLQGRVTGSHLHLDAFDGQLLRLASCCR